MSNNYSGWIKLHRKMTDWEWYTDIPVKVLYIHLLIKANHEDGRWQGKEIKRGELITSLSHLADETGLSVKQVRTALSKLEKTGEISRDGTNAYTFIKCLNYSVYQSREFDKGQAEDNQTADKRQAGGSKQEYKNYKNKKNDKKMHRKPSFDINEIARRAKLNDNYEL